MGMTGRLTDLWGSANARFLDSHRQAADVAGGLGAVALRLVKRPGGWQVDDIARPEDGPLPPASFPIGHDEDDDTIDGNRGADIAALGAYATECRRKSREPQLFPMSAKRRSMWRVTPG